jgi:A/G-specific adenine glycosylase
MDDSESQFDTAARSRIRRRLLAWYAANRRDLPWRRRGSDAYAQMLAELMLQQTQVATVIGYYQRFLARFPTIGDLARADINDVLALWSGLGYYSRARHLHAAARMVVERHGGVVPSDVPTLMSMPGIGRYTAGAIASIAYGTRAAVLDGNVARVLTRLMAVRKDPKLPAVREALWEAAESLLPRTKCGEFNQALMELGATRCRSRIPACTECPLQRECRAHALGLTVRIPRAARRVKVKTVEHVVAAIRHDGRLLFSQRPPRGLWAGLWELPNEPLAPGESSAEGLRRLQTQLGSKCLIDGTAQVGTATRQLSHRRITFHLFEGRTTRGTLSGDRCPARLSGKAAGSAQGAIRPVASIPGFRWLSPEDLPLTGISRASLAILKLLAWTA